MRFVQQPNLPIGEIGLAAVSRTYPGLTAALRNLGMLVLETGPEMSLGACSCHADMLCHHLGGRKIICAKGNQALKEKLSGYGFDVLESSSPIHGPYPDDVALNGLRIGDRLFARRASLDATIVRYCDAHKIRIIPVRQGYAKCSAAVVDEESFITSDPGIAESGVRAGLQVLQIEPGFIRLDGCRYGFIGGACGKIGKTTMAFTGKLDAHPDGIKIENFLAQRGIYGIALIDAPLIDVGGILPLMER